eukprot:COSAG06_NODE_4438_length_4267_cov_1.083733_4_plen_64_part_00
MHGDGPQSLQDLPVPKTDTVPPPCVPQYACSINASFPEKLSADADHGLSQVEKPRVQTEPSRA